MIQIFLGINIVFMILAFSMIFFSRTMWNRLLALSLCSSLMGLAIVLYAVHAGQSMYLDIALIFIILGFMDVQFFSVFFRKKGEESWEISSEKSSSELDS